MRRETGSVIGAAAVGIAVLWCGSLSGHVAIASRYTYNEHLFPIFQERCGSCHVEGGIAPMSLLTYEEAFPWTQSIREEVMSLRMPPWKAEDGFGSFSNGHVLAAHEMDMILEWSAGGHPRGALAETPDVSALAALDWTLGSPTVELSLPEPFTLEAGVSETVRYFTLPTDLGGDRWVTGLDVLPGSQPVVRHVSVYIDTTGQAGAADAADPGPGFASYEGDEPIAVWWPGQRAVKHDQVGYALPAGADLVARVLYKKTWITEGQAFTDQTRFGLHLVEDGVTALEHTVLSSSEEIDERDVLFSQTLDRDVNLFGLLPEIAVDALELVVEGVLPDGTRVPLLLIREPDARWPTRYWLEAARSLPAGTRIEVLATLSPGANRQTVPSLFAASAPVRLLLDYTSGTGAAN